MSATSAVKPNAEYLDPNSILTETNLSNLYNLEWNRRMSLLFGLLNENQRIPNKLYITEINGTSLFGKLNSEFTECYRHHQSIVQEKNEIEKLSYFFIVRRDILVNFEQDHEYNGKASVVFAQDVPSGDIEFLTELINSCKQLSGDKKHFHLLTNPSYGLDLKKVELAEMDLDLKTHYNDDFIEFDQYLTKGINSQKRTGRIVLLNGLYGTGKTYYIRHLISTLPLEFIYLTPSMAVLLDRPDLTDLLMNSTKDKAIVIEDAEQLIGKRNEMNGSIVSSILNLSDGIMGDSLKVKLIIITCNSKLSDIDPAILRKGRLLANYEFNKLEKKKAQHLSDQLGFNSVITDDISLADIYNQEMKGISEKSEKIGFRVS